MARSPAWRIASVEQTGERTFGPKPDARAGARLASGSLRSDQSWTAGIAGEMTVKGTAATDPRAASRRS
jgi:hypothetical protein